MKNWSKEDLQGLGSLGDDSGLIIAAVIVIGALGVFLLGMTVYTVFSS